MGELPTDPDRNPTRPEVIWTAPELEQDETPIVVEDDRVTSMIVTSGSSFELLTGLAAIAFSLLGLAGYHPVAMASIATIAVGLSLLAQGSTVAARWREAVKIQGRQSTDAFGIGTEMFGGLAGIILGVLALAEVMALTLLPAGAIVLGFSLLLGAPAQPDIAEIPTPASPRRWHVTRDTVRASSGVLVMAGLGAIVMGVLASIGIAPVVQLSLVATLCTAAALVMSGVTLVARFARRHA
jgi:hypothetical protein